MGRLSEDSAEVDRRNGESGLAHRRFYRSCPACHLLLMAYNEREKAIGVCHGRGLASNSARGTHR